MAVLVTGGAGYIGSHTAVVLHDAGRDVVVLDDLSNSSVAAVEALRALTRPDLPFIRADAADVDAVGRAIVDHGIDEVVHFAAFKSVSGSIADPDGYHRNNVGSTVGVVEAMRRNGVSRIVFSSSCTVYGEPTSLPVTEDSLIGASNPYGATKVACEELLAVEADVGGLDVLLLRYFNPVGAHSSGDLGEDPRGTPDNLVPYLMQVAVGRRESLSVFGDDYDTPDGTCVRDYIHVEDLGDAHLRALVKLQTGTQRLACNLGTGTGFSVREVIEVARKVTGHEIPARVVGRREGDPAMLVSGGTEAKRLLGWEANRGDLESIVSDAWRFLKAHPNGYGK